METDGFKFNITVNCIADIHMMAYLGRARELSPLMDAFYTRNGPVGVKMV